MRFSIVVVALNPGDKLADSLESVFSQTYADYEVILKDGGSTDGSLEAAKRRCGEEQWARRVRVFCEKDSGIYDAMNQAVSHVSGEFILFLNCGDLFADERVLERAAEVAGGEGLRRTVLYGDTFGEKTGVVIASAPEITGFTCYRNIPCHQSCFYSADLCREKPYDVNYRIRADYDHFLWCFYRAGARFVHMDFAVSSYEGGGYSESAANRQRDGQEHREITRKYMSALELFRYRAIMALTLAPIRRWMAENKALSGVYHRVKEKLYGR